MKLLRSIWLLLFLVTGLVSCAQEPVLNEDLCLKYLVHKAEGKATNPPVLILLHGYGSNERDLFELTKGLPPNWIIITARAPMDASSGYQWYTMNRDNGHHSGSVTDLDHSRDLVVKFIGQIVKKYHADPKRIYLGGFSQGAMMSYLVGLSHPEAVAGIAPLSGMIIEKLKPEFKLDKAKTNLRIFVGHGDADERIPVADAKAAVDYLKQNGLKPEFHTYPGMGHSISRKELTDLSHWLSK